MNKLLTIEGAGAESSILDGGGVDRVIDVLPLGDLTLIGVTIRNGQAPGGEDGGGIRSRGFLTLQRVVVTGCRADRGGGIYGAGPLTVLDSTVSGNAATDAGGGVMAVATSLSVPARVERSTIRGNLAGGGGAGIVNAGAPGIPAVMTLRDSTVSGNVTTDQGGGILNLLGALTLVGSTVSGNTALSVGGIGSLGAATIENSTVSGNTAIGAIGGVVVEGFLSVTHGTLTGNLSAAHARELFVSGRALVQGTIISSSDALACEVDVGGMLASAGHNLDRGTSCGFATMPGTSTGSIPGSARSPTTGDSPRPTRSSRGAPRSERGIRSGVRGWTSGG